MSEYLLNKKLKKTFKQEKKTINHTKNFTYEGQIYKFKRSGYGKFYLDDQSYYQGEFQDGELNGQGEYYLAFTGWHYKGNFLKGEKHGQGILQKENYIFNGNFQNGVKEGDFEEIFKDKGYLQRGTYKNGVLQNQFKRISLKDNIVLIDCTLLNGLKQGQGLFENDSIKYEGNFKNDFKEGMGTLLDKINGLVYKGDFQNDIPTKTVNFMDAKFSIQSVDKTNQIQYIELKQQNDKFKMESSKIYSIHINNYQKEMKKEEDIQLETENNKQKKGKQLESDTYTQQLIEEESSRPISYLLQKIDKENEDTTYVIDFFYEYQQLLQQEQPYELDLTQKNFRQPIFKTDKGQLDINIVFPDNIPSGNYELIIKDLTIKNKYFNQLEELRFQIEIASKLKN